MTTITDERREYLRIKQAERRAKLKAAGIQPKSGPSGPSGGQATSAERSRRYREPLKARALNQA